MAEAPLSPVSAHMVSARMVSVHPALPALRRPRLSARPFRETPVEALSRWIFGIAYTCHPKRVASLPFLLGWTLLDLLRGGTQIPDRARVRSRPDGFAGICRGLSPDTILAAARAGFFPWCHLGPLKWWTRTNRAVRLLDASRMSAHLRRDMRRSTYRVTFDCAFDAVIEACAERRRNRSFRLTWITPQIMRLYSELHRQGHVHSVEVWSADGRLVAGSYGLSVGRTFVAESMFSRESNSSKMAFATLVYHLRRWGYVLIDGKDLTPALELMGFRAMPRAEFEALLDRHAHAGDRPGPWTVEADLATIAAEEAIAATACAKERDERTVLAHRQLRA